jgi:threonine/homoserine/homoserine lactone efflux protein
MRPSPAPPARRARASAISASFGRWLNRVSALVFVGLAVRLVLTERALMGDVDGGGAD